MWKVTMTNRRQYFTEAELGKLISAARKGRYGHRDPYAHSISDCFRLALQNVRSRIPMLFLRFLFLRFQCPLSGVKRTLTDRYEMSAFDPKRTSAIKFAVLLSSSNSFSSLQAVA
jgi:hypothetical protein